MWVEYQKLLRIDHETGILIPSENPSKMSDTINSLLDDEELQKKLTKNAHDFINKFFSWEVLLPKYLKLYAD